MYTKVLLYIVMTNNMYWNLYSGFHSQLQKHSLDQKNNQDLKNNSQKNIEINWDLEKKLGL